MIQLIESYTWQQAAARSKLDKLQAEINTVCFSIEGVPEDVFELSRYAAIEGMKVFAERLEDDWNRRKEEILQKYPKFDFDKHFKIEIYDQEPTGKRVSLEEFVGFNYEKDCVNVHDYTKFPLAYALLEPPYGINIPITAGHGSKEYFSVKTQEYTAIYRMFLNDFVLLTHYQKEDFIIYSWSDDWSNFFDAGKEWWGTYYWTVYNKKSNTIMVMGASATD